MPSTLCRRPDVAALAFVDTETTGVHPGRHAWEIAIIRREEDGKERVANYMLPVDLSNADPFGLKIGGFYDRHPQGRYLSRKTSIPAAGLTSLPQAAEWVAQFTHGAHLVGAVPNFDSEVLDKLLRSQGLIPAWHYHLIDVEALAVGYLSARHGVPVDLPWKSDALSQACGVSPPTEEERHTAEGDARWAMRWYDAIVKGEDA